MSMRSRSFPVVVLTTLLGACANVNIPSATPADQLPDLMVPQEVMAAAGGRKSSGSDGSTAAGAAGSDADTDTDGDARGCGCRSDGHARASWWLLTALTLTRRRSSMR